MANNGVVTIRGREYTMVSARVARFREQHPDWTIQTDLVLQDQERVIMKASILDGERLIATGYAEEIRGSTQINETSAVENCETSAIGRALAAFGLAGSEYASADELSGALIQQKEREMWAANRAFMDAFEGNYDSIQAVRGFLAEDNFDAAKEAMSEIPNEDKLALNRAWTKGGAFNPRETKQLKWGSNDFEKTRNG
jgi:hypothetical protein